jgi:hypothetical protein
MTLHLFPRRRIILVFALILIGTVRSVHAAEPRDFMWMRPLTGDVQPGAWVQVPIPPDVYGACHTFPHDIRIIDEEGHQWPFFLAPRPSEPVYRSVEVDTLNTGWIEGPERYLRVDLAIAPGPDGIPSRHQQLRVETSGQDFIRRIEVYGAERQGDWGRLGEGYLIRSRTPRRLDEAVLDYPQSDYSRLQIRIYPRTRDATEMFSIQQIGVLGRIEPEPRLVSRPFNRIANPQPTTHTNAQVLELDLHHEKLPMAEIRLRAEDGDYVRRVDVFTRNTPEESWRRNRSAEIYRVGPSVRDRVPLHQSARFVRLELVHDDDPPLVLQDIEALGYLDHIVVEARQGADPMFYYGSATARPPGYDLQARVRRSPERILESRSLGPVSPNTGYRSSGYGPWGAYLATLAIAVTSLIVIAVVVRMLKQIQREAA